MDSAWDCNGAAAEFQTMLDHRGIVGADPIGGRAHLHTKEGGTYERSVFLTRRRGDAHCLWWRLIFSDAALCPLSQNGVVGYATFRLRERSRQLLGEGTTDQMVGGDFLGLTYADNSVGPLDHC